MRFLNSLLLILLYFGCVSVGQAQNIPPKPSPNEGLVIDYVDLLTAPQRAEMNQRLIAFDDSSSVQIAVVIIQSLSGGSAQEMATAIGRSWGVGQAEFDNGVVVLLAVGDREVFIATGYGMEGAIPDVTASRIVNREMIPHFRRDNYYEGLKAGTEAIIAAASGEYVASRSRFPVALVLFGIVFVFIVVSIIIFNAIKSGGGGGSTGQRAPGRWQSSSSGGSFSSSRSSGSFGGFGGGSFGGGGAGGRW